MRRNLMPPRPRWNHYGPKLPAWFRPKMRKIDDALCLQFLVPTFVHPDGVEPEHYPNGVWIITRRMPHVGWLMLHKTWTWSLARQFPDGKWRHREPTYEDIEILRIGRDYWRRGEGWRLMHELEDSIRRFQREKAEDSREWNLSMIANTMRRLDMKQGKHVVVPQMVA